MARFLTLFGRVKSCMKPTLVACVLCTLWTLLYYSMAKDYSITDFTVAFINSSRNNDNLIFNEVLPISVVTTEHCLDVHIDGTGDVYSECAPHHGNHWGEPSKQVAIGGGITSTGLSNYDRATLKAHFPLFTVFLPSFCRTLTEGYHYHFYLGHDHVDAYFKSNENQKEFSSIFYDRISELCPKNTNVTLHLIVCSHHKKPAWAQSDAMVEAYIDNIEYFYRVNDDTEMETPGWLDAFISVLSSYKPINVGVVGPMHSGGNVAILTYDFTHKTHIEVFGFHYPRDLTDWWADDWVTYVYQPGRSTKLNNIHLKHTLQMGQRYQTDFQKEKIIGKVIEKSKQILNRYIQYREATGLPQADGRKVIAMSLFGKDPKYTYGAIRNAQIVKMFFPGWNLRFYIPSASSKEEWLVPKRIIFRLQLLGAEMVHVMPSLNIPPQFWSALIADNKSVNYFLIRNPDQRLSDRDFELVEDWLNTKRPFHCIRDHQSHVPLSIVQGLWGAKVEDFAKLRSVSMLATIQQAILKAKSTSVQEFLNAVLWPLVKSSAYCHDSVSCDKWPNSVSISSKRQENVYLGQSFDAYGTVLNYLPSLPESSSMNCSGIVQTS